MSPSPKSAIKSTHLRPVSVMSPLPSSSAASTVGDPAAVVYVPTPLFGMSAPLMPSNPRSSGRSRCRDRKDLLRNQSSSAFSAKRRPRHRSECAGRPLLHGESWPSPPRYARVSIAIDRSYFFSGYQAVRVVVRWMPPSASDMLNCIVAHHVGMNEVGIPSSVSPGVTYSVHARSQWRSHRRDRVTILRNLKLTRATTGSKRSTCLRTVRLGRHDVTGRRPWRPSTAESLLHSPWSNPEPEQSRTDC